MKTSVSDGYRMSEGDRELAFDAVPCSFTPKLTPRSGLDEELGSLEEDLAFLNLRKNDTIDHC